jgi:Kef-type K+ transport system membrane component KefB
MTPDQVAQCLLYVIVALLLAKLLGELAERLKQAPVVGELLAGVILGGGVLGFIRLDNPMHLTASTSALVLLAELGVILLLFEVGLESDLDDFLKVGPSALMVAVVGVTGPFVVGFFVSRWFGLSTPVSVFMGASLTATSVGVTARTFSDLGQINTNVARIVLGAAVIDDVLGLIILAVVSSVVTDGSVSLAKVAITAGTAIAFLVGGIVIGLRLAPYMLVAAKQVRTRGMLTISAFLFCLVFAYVAHKLGLAPIVGAFAAGLILAKTEDQVHIQASMKPLADILIPIFFVMLGVSVNIAVFNPYSNAYSGSLALAGALIVTAILMKVVAGLGVLRKGVNRLAVGVGMIPRGEVGLFFASIGWSRRIINSTEYAAILAVVIVTTIITPPILKLVLAKRAGKARHA